MKLIDGKSVLFGIGIGIIIAAMLGFIFFLGYEPRLSDSEIIERAKRLGMTDITAEADGVTRNRDGSLTLVIKEGEDASAVAERLLRFGIIESSIEFELAIRRKDLQNSIKPGEYVISYQDNIDEIIGRITQ